MVRRLKERSELPTAQTFYDEVDNCLLGVAALGLFGNAAERSHVMQIGHFFLAFFFEPS